MSKAGKMRDIILEVLSDGKEHAIGEIKERIIERDSNLLSSKNALSSVLYQMGRKEYPEVIRTSKAMYRIVNCEKRNLRITTSTSEKQEDVKETMYQQVKDVPTAKELGSLEYTTVSKLITLIKEAQKELLPVNIDMSIEDFAKYKQVYELFKVLMETANIYLNEGVIPEFQPEARN